MKCENCSEDIINKIGSGRFCSLKCARSFSRCSDKKEFKKLNCITCGKEIEVDKRASHKLCKCDDCKKYKKYNNPKKRKIIDKEIFINTCLSSISMRQASIQLNIPFSTFSRYAKKWKVYNTSQGGKNTLKKEQIKLEDLFNGKRIKIKPREVKTKLLKNKYKEYKCEKCNLIEWNNQKISLELHHIDGDTYNNKLENLIILCPNCHSQTLTYRRKKNIKNADMV